MAKSYKVLAQSAPAADVQTELIEVPVGKEAVISLLNVCNRHDTEVDAYYVAIVPSGDVLGDKHWVRSKHSIDNRDAKEMLSGLGLSAGDKIYVKSLEGNLSFTLTGVVF